MRRHTCGAPFDCLPQGACSSRTPLFVAAHQGASVRYSGYLCGASQRLQLLAKSSIPPPSGVRRSIPFTVRMECEKSVCIHGSRGAFYPERSSRLQLLGRKGGRIRCPSCGGLYKPTPLPQPTTPFTQPHAYLIHTKLFYLSALWGAGRSARRILAI